MIVLTPAMLDDAMRLVNVCASCSRTEVESKCCSPCGGVWLGYSHKGGEAECVRLRVHTIISLLKARG